MSYKKYNFATAAHDSNSPFFRNYIWTKAFFRHEEVARLAGGTISIKNDLEYITDMATWRAIHEEFKIKALADDNYLNDLIDVTNSFGEEFNQWSEQNILKSNLRDRTPRQLIKLLYSFADRQAALDGYGFVIPILDFLDFAYVEGSLEKFLKKKVKASQYIEYFSVFTYPMYDSFAQEQEKDLLGLMAKFWDKKEIWQNLSVLPSRKEVEYLEQNQKSFYQALQKHTQKHAWVYYAYNGPAYKEVDFLNFIKDYLIKKIDPQTELNRLNKERRKFNSLKTKYTKELKPNKFEANILQLAGKVVWGKPRRKDHQSKSYYHSEKLLTEIGRRLYMSLNQVRSTPFNILEEALLGGEPVDIHYVNDLYRYHICLPNDDESVTILIGKQAENFSKNKVKRVAPKITASKTIKGDTACPGKVKGIVKIINDISDMVKMNYGDILVSCATNPNLVPAIKKAAAIIADEGGLTCHAAIVSRELGTPCVVNTRFATQILKDGDTVEVDANRGVIKIIK